MSKAVKRTVGSPINRDPEVAKLFKAMKSAVELVRDLEGKVTDETHLHLKASALGLMVAYSELTGMPSPYEGLYSLAA